MTFENGSQIGTISSSEDDIKSYTNPKDQDDDLDVELAKLIIPRLKKFKEDSIGFPSEIIVESLSHLSFWDQYTRNYSNLSSKEKDLCDKICMENWRDKIDSMIEAFELCIKDMDDSEDWIKLEGEEKINIGLNNFARFFRNLWI